MKHLLLIPIACALLSGCAEPGPYIAYDDGQDQELAEMSVGYVACPVSDMEIHDHGYAPDGITHEWSVDCYGQRYYCASDPVSPYTDDTSCSFAMWVH